MNRHNLALAYIKRLQLSFRTHTEIYEFHNSPTVPELSFSQKIFSSVCRGGSFLTGSSSPRDKCIGAKLVSASRCILGGFRSRVPASVGER